jgi:hypothetical protein
VIVGAPRTEVAARVSGVELARGVVTPATRVAGALADESWPPKTDGTRKTRAIAAATTSGAAMKTGLKRDIRWI